MFVPLNEVPNEMLPACFLLKLQPAMPVMPSFVKKLSQITGQGGFHEYFVKWTWNKKPAHYCCSVSDYFLDVTVPDVDLQWAPLPKLLMRDSLSASSSWEMTCESNMIFTVV